MIHNSQYAKAVTTLIAFALFVTGCTKTREARLSDPDSLAIFAISDFGTVKDSAGFDVPAKPAIRNTSTNSNKASLEKTQVALDADESNIPERLRFMFSGVEVSGQSAKSMKIVFGVDSKYVTAYKVTSDIASLSALEKQLAVSSTEVQTAISMQKAKTNGDLRTLSNSLTAATKARQQAIAARQPISLLIPLFKYQIQAKGILERTKNELREDTSNLNLKETEFYQATHIRLAQTSDSREEVGSAEQQTEMDQIYASDTLDDMVTTAQELQNRLNINMKFIPDNAKVLTKLDVKDLKVYEVIDIKSLTEDEARRFTTGNANGEIIACKDEPTLNNKDANCVIRLAARVPVEYQKASLTLADKKGGTKGAIQLEKTTKAQNTGLVKIAKESSAARARPGGSFDPLNTIKISELQGSFYFRRTFESASNMMTAGWAGTSGDMSVISFELEKDRLVVRNQKALIAYVGQGPKDKEELMSLPVKYYKLETADADGSALQVARLIEAKKEDAEYLEVDFTKSTIPTANSPLAFFDMGDCIAAGSQQVAGMDMRLAKDGMLNFSIEGGYTMKPGCQATGLPYDYQWNFDISERLSFRKITNRGDFEQFAPNWSTTFQNALNFNIFTLTDVNIGRDIREGREASRSFKPTIHDFRNGKVLHYWVGGLTKDTPQERRDIIIKVAQDAVAEWNVIFHKVFAGTENDRSGDYIVLHTEQDGRLGDLDRNYIWFMDIQTKNGLLGVAQSAPNPYSGTNIANNVIIYSGNIESSVSNMIQAQKEARKYEQLLGKAKETAIANMQKAQAAQAAEEAAAAKGKVAPEAAGKDAVEQMKKVGRQYDASLKRLLLSAHPERASDINSKNLMNRYSQIKQRHPQISHLRNQISDVKLDSEKSFTRRILEQAFKSEFKNNPAMLEAIIAREMARTEPGLSQEIRDALKQQAQMNESKARFEASAKLRGGCFLHENDRGQYNDAFLAQDFNEAFRKELLLTLSHEMGHALGLNHNFKASYDKANFEFNGEKTGRNYSSVMDYQASSEMNYQGPGPYDLHALRAIYTGRIEISDVAMKLIKGSALNVEKTNEKGEKEVVRSMPVKDGMIKVSDFQKFIGFKYASDMVKKNVRDTGYLKEYAQCNDSQQGGEVPACTQYDNGTSATEIVKNAIQDYNRLYNRSYVASDRLRFSWNDKVTVLRSALGIFQEIRGVLDDLFKMAIYETAASDEELQDYLNASQLGYDFFHELIRTPDTDSAHGEEENEILARLLVAPYQYQEVTVGKDGKQVATAKTDVRVVEARPLYDQFDSPDRISTIGIGYDKSFALEFLMTANPVGGTDDSQTGWISYNEFEQYFKGVESAAQSPNMITMLEIMADQLQAGIMTPSHNLVSLGRSVTVSRQMTNNATIGVIANTNAFRMVGLDSNAEFFKVGTLKGGKKLSDRLTVTRYGQPSKSETAVRFFAPDNGFGASALINTAARRSVVLENKAVIGKKMMEIFAGDQALKTKVGELLKTDAFKGKTGQDVVNTDETAKKMLADNQKAAGELIAQLNALNVGGVLVADEELKENPNLALDKQVQMVRSLLINTQSNLFQIVGLLQSMPLNDFIEQVVPQLDEVKAKNKELATSPILALALEIMYEAVPSNVIQTADGKKVNVKAIASRMLIQNALTSPHEKMMYVIEDLARYTKIFNPEYEY